MLYIASAEVVRTAEEPYVGVVAAGYPTKYIEVICQSQQKLFFLLSEI
jgi:hypothetical protein